MRHHLCLSGLSRPENRRKTSHVYDVEVCIVVQQDFCCMRLGCSRLLHRWGTPHQCFLHQLYKICVLQLWSKHWTSAHKQSMYNYILHNAKTGTATLKKKNTQLQLFPASFNSKVHVHCWRRKKLDSGSQSPNDPRSTPAAKETHTSVWGKTLQVFATKGRLFSLTNFAAG